MLLIQQLYNNEEQEVWDNAYKKHKKTNKKTNFKDVNRSENIITFEYLQL